MNKIPKSNQIYRAKRVSVNTETNDIVFCIKISKERFLAHYIETDCAWIYNFNSNKKYKWFLNESILSGRTFFDCFEEI